MATDLIKEKDNAQNRVLHDEKIQSKTKNKIVRKVLKVQKKVAQIGFFSDLHNLFLYS